MFLDYLTRMVESRAWEGLEAPDGSPLTLGKALTESIPHGAGLLRDDILKMLAISYGLDGAERTVKADGRTWAEHVRAACRDVRTALEDVVPPLAPVGSNGVLIHKTPAKNAGTGRDYTIARLKRDGETDPAKADLVRQVIDGAITAAEGRRRAGYGVATMQLPKDPGLFAQRLMARPDCAEYLRALAEHDPDALHAALDAIMPRPISTATNLQEKQG